MNTQAEAVLEFWFSETVRPLWFNSTPEFDRQLQQRFEPLVVAAQKGLLDEWKNDPRSALALTLVLDQFPLNIYRGQAASFATEKSAIMVSKDAIAAGYDSALTNEEKAFLYIPLMHSENLADQDASVALFQKAGLEENAKFAKHHRDIIKRFGRFPHRNAILGRASSAAEIEYLESDDAFKG